MSYLRSSLKLTPLDESKLAWDTKPTDKGIEYAVTYDYKGNEIRAFCERAPDSEWNDEVRNALKIRTQEAVAVVEQYPHLIPKKDVAA